MEVFSIFGNTQTPIIEYELKAMESTPMLSSLSLSLSLLALNSLRLCFFCKKVIQLKLRLRRDNTFYDISFGISICKGCYTDARHKWVMPQSFANPHPRFAKIGLLGVFSIQSVKR